jgi:hypothetical protein
MIELITSVVEAPGVGRFFETELTSIEVVAVLVQQGMEKTLEARDPRMHCGAHPDSNALGFESVISKQFIGTSRSTTEYRDLWTRNPMKVCQKMND